MSKFFNGNTRPGGETRSNNDCLSIDQLVHQDDWVCDNERYRCHVCTRNFNSFRRKHHCRRCGEVVCRNCTLYKDAELPVIGRSRVRVCMSCILNDSNPNENPQSPGVRSRDLPRNEQGSGRQEQAWISQHVHSPTGESEHSFGEGDSGIMYQHEVVEYPLDFDWDYPWPRPPLPADEKERLQVLRSFDILDTPPEDVFNLVCELASNALKCPIAAVSLIDEDRQWFKASAGLAQKEIPRNIAFCAHTIYSKEPLVVLDTRKDKRFQYNPLVTGAAGIRFYAGAAICSSSGHVLGTVFVFDTQTRETCDVATLEKLANVAMKNMEDRKSAIAKPVNKTQGSLTTQSPYKQGRVESFEGRYSDEGSSEAGPITMARSDQAGMVQHGNNGQMVQAGQPGALTTGSNMEAMLMDLLCRTTETQQQLATQQGAMFQTLGSHSSQIDKLTDAVSRLEARLDEKERSVART